MKDLLCGRRFSNSDDLQSSVHELVPTIPKDCLPHPSGSYQKDGSGVLTSVGSSWSVLKCDCLAVIISQPVFQASPSHFSVTLIHNDKDSGEVSCVKIYKLGNLFIYLIGIEMKNKMSC
jgi:hypothetical protein